MSYTNSTSKTLFEEYFESRLAQVEPGLQRRIAYHMKTGTDDQNDALQEVRILMRKKYTEDPAYWATVDIEHWHKYIHACLHWAMLNVSGLGRRRHKREVQGSDLAIVGSTDETNIDDLLSLGSLAEFTPIVFRRYFIFFGLIEIASYLWIATKLFGVNRKKIGKLGETCPRKHDRVYT